MPTIEVKSESSGDITTFLDDSVIVSGDGVGTREVPAGTTHTVSWTVTGKGSSYEVHVTRPASAKRDRKVEKTTKPVVNGGFKPFKV